MIPERYDAEADAEHLTEAEKSERQEKADRIKRLLTNQRYACCLIDGSFQYSLISYFQYSLANIVSFSCCRYFEMCVSVLINVQVIKRQKNAVLTC